MTKRKNKPEPVLPPPAFPSVWDRMPYSTPEGQQEMERLLPAIADRVTFWKDIEVTVYHVCLAHDEQCGSDPKAAYEQLDDLCRKFQGLIASGDARSRSPELSKRRSDMGRVAATCASVDEGMEQPDRRSAGEGQR